MKFSVAVLALLCLGMGANASSKALGVKFNKTANGVHVDLPDITVPKVSMPELNLAVNVKKPTLNTTTIDLPDFTIPTLSKPNVDLSGLTALMKGASNSTSLAGLLKKSQVDLSALQNAVQGALQFKAGLTAEAVGALQTLATAVYQAKYNVTSRIADMALEALSKKPTISLPVPQVNMSSLTSMLNKNGSGLDFQMPHLDLSALQGMFSKNVSAPQVDVAALISALVTAKAAATPTINLPTMDLQPLLDSFQAAKDGLNETLHQKFDINHYVDVAGLQQSLAELVATVERPKINVVETIQNAIAAHNNQTTKDIQSLMTALASQSKKNATADLVGFLDSLKQQRTVNFTIPTLQLPKMPTVNIAAVGETLQTLKNVTASIAADELKSAAILAWLKDAGFYQIKDAVTGAASGKTGGATGGKAAKGSKGADGSKDGPVTINLGKN